MKRESQTNQSLMKLLGAVAVGAVAMYMSDPERGRRRRALASDKMRSLAVRTGDAIDVASRDLGNRMQGLRAQASRIFSRRSGSTVDDEVLMARVRKEIGRAVSHPRAIKVTAQQGCVRLYGPVFSHEKQQLLDCVSSVAGVSEVQDNLEAHETAEHIPSLQGEGKMRNSTSPALQESWPPGLRAIATVGGGALSIYGVARRSPGGVLAAAIGLGLLTRSLVNKPLARVTGMGAPGHVVDVHKSIEIAAPPETVFDTWARYENFPHFMSNVHEVTDLGNGRSHWVVRGPAGTRVEWDAVMTEAIRPELLAWISEPDASVQHTGRVHFERSGTGTRVTVQMSYNPPAGVVGAAVASLFNGSPKQQMDQDLMRMKEFIETGIVPRDAAQKTQPSGATILH